MTDYLKGLYITYICKQKENNFGVSFRAVNRIKMYKATILPVVFMDVKR
jgi:hypothetical protein